MDVYFEPGTPQAWQWTLLAPYIQSCPAENPRIGWSNYATLKVKNNPVLHYAGSKAAVSTNQSTQPLVHPNETFYFDWTPAGEKVGPNKSYTTVSPGGSTPKYALWVHQLNASYSPLTLTSETSGYAKLPSGPVFNTNIAKTGPAINGTGFVALTNKDPLDPIQPQPYLASHGSRSRNLPGRLKAFLEQVCVTVSTSFRQNVTGERSAELCSTSVSIYPSYPDPIRWKLLLCKRD